MTSFFGGGSSQNNTDDEQDPLGITNESDRRALLALACEHDRVDILQSLLTIPEDEDCEEGDDGGDDNSAKAGGTTATGIGGPKLDLSLLHSPLTPPIPSTRKKVKGSSRKDNDVFVVKSESKDEEEEEEEEEEGSEEEIQVPWFELAWQRIVEVAFRYATETGGRETLELRLAGVDLLVLCAQLSCRDGISAAATPVRVGTNMMVVNGALRSVRASVSNTTNTSDGAVSTNGKDPLGPTEQINSQRHRLFILAFEMLERFTNHFDENDSTDEEDCYQMMCGETTALQVFTRIASGLAKIYECCKDHELAPSPDTDFALSFGKNMDCDREHKDNLEARLVHLVSFVAVKSVGDPGARYLNQSQRICIDLLRDMSTLSSSRAFAALAVMGGNSFVLKNSNEDDDEDEDLDDIQPACELIEYEAAKVVADTFMKEGVPQVAKVSVLSMVLGIFLQKKEHMKNGRTELETKEDSGLFSSDRNNVLDESLACYDLLVPVVKGGIGAASELEKEVLAPLNYNEESEKQNQMRISLLETLWKRTIATLSYLLSPMERPIHNSFTPHTEPILELLSCVISHVPNRLYSDLGVVLSIGASHAEQAGKGHLDQDASISGGDDAKVGRLIEDELRVFNACIIGLCQCQPQSTLLRKITEGALKNAIQCSEQPEINNCLKLSQPFNENEISGKYSNGVFENGKIAIYVKVALMVLEAIRTGGPSLNNLKVSVFPWLCKLTNVENDKLRRKAGAVLGCINLAEVIAQGVQRAEAAEKRVTAAEQRRKELEKEVEDLNEEMDMLQKQMTNLAVNTEFLG